MFHTFFLLVFCTWNDGDEREESDQRASDFFAAKSHLVHPNSLNFQRLLYGIYYKHLLHTLSSIAEQLVSFHITVGVDVLPRDDIGVSWADHGVDLSEGE